MSLFNFKMSQIQRIYRILMKEYGPQGWWPVTENGSLHPEYSGGPKSENQQLEVVFGAILTQNTSWKNAEKAIIELNEHSLIDISKIAKIENEKLAYVIKSSGYHSQKAKKLKNFCGFLLKKHDGSLKRLFRMDIRNLREDLLSVNGIGPETADSIILYAAQKPIFVIDAYTKRILSRVGCGESDYDSLQKLFMENLENNEKLFNECHALLVRLGKNICKKEPLCQKCPLNARCGYAQKFHRA